MIWWRLSSSAKAIKQLPAGCAAHKQNLQTAACHVYVIWDMKYIYTHLYTYTVKNFVKKSTQNLCLNFFQTIFTQKLC